jgi:hypothetical protein
VACVVTIAVLVSGWWNLEIQAVGMPTFYFGLWNGQRIRPDEGGLPLEGAEEAFEMALEGARHLLDEARPTGEDRSDWAYHVHDDQGRRVFTVPFSIAARDPHYARAPTQRRRAT